MASPINRRDSHYGKVKEFFKKHSVGVIAEQDRKSSDIDSRSLAALSGNAVRDQSPPLSPASLSTVGTHVNAYASPTGAPGMAMAAPPRQGITTCCSRKVTVQCTFTQPGISNNVGRTLVSDLFGCVRHPWRMGLSIREDQERTIDFYIWNFPDHQSSQDGGNGAAGNTKAGGMLGHGRSASTASSAAALQAARQREKEREMAMTSKDVYVNVWLRNTAGVVLFHASLSDVFEAETNWCWKDVCRLPELTSDARMTADDTLVVDVEIEWPADSRSITPTPEFERLLKEGLHADAVLQLQDCDVPVHRAILAARSKYFEDLFAGSDHDSTAQTDSDAASARAAVQKFAVDESNHLFARVLLRYLYTGHYEEGDSSDFFERTNTASDAEGLSTDEDNDDDDEDDDDHRPLGESVQRRESVVFAQRRALFALADKYQVDGLKRRVADRWIEEMAVDNVMQVVRVAYDFSDERLQQSCIRFVVANMREVKQSVDYVELVLCGQYNVFLAKLIDAVTE
ncbi:hypothetical protein SYNPS1DRAFT_22189 [Syncephalis pseudoplumigaleata]|uniref:BTB domain-containing protein n=1 Tax=Syncephalis pseudoplumigaleata TaxID=1712513 RepID=A0A4P9Z0Y7_9FUNG|nr:hypothetical protein SYNPS1DRAFT_22189 [Syncephalis pseudoplumigaleata]|eukprot:RKP25945.1 hypothetical protein SYNPS1DRAFT_22189 [Syncephalis pseudoplumigaleata]